MCWPIILKRRADRPILPQIFIVLLKELRICTKNYGLLGDVFPLYLVFAVGAIFSLAHMLFLCFHPKTREFILKHCD